jgi:hypothetical protein
MTTDKTEPAGGASLLHAELEGAYGAKALEILLAMAQMAADGKSLTIAEDWGFGSATVIDQDGAHTHVGLDCLESDQENFKAFVDQLHGLLVDKRGLSWVKPSNEKLTGAAPAVAEPE